MWIVKRAVAYRAGLTTDDPAIQRLRDAYLEPWGDLASATALRRAADLGAVLVSVTRALCWYRVATLNEGVLEDEPDVVSSRLETVESAVKGE